MIANFRNMVQIAGEKLTRFSAVFLESGDGKIIFKYVVQNPKKHQELQWVKGHMELSDAKDLYEALGHVIDEAGRIEPQTPLDEIRMQMMAPYPGP